MIVFVDFEASSLGRHGFPISVGWAADTGEEECHLIRPAPGWEEWSEEAERIHRLSFGLLVREGASHEFVARRMVEVLSGAELYASAPSWDGKWLSTLLRAAGLPRHALRLQSSKEARRILASDLLQGKVPEGSRAGAVETIVAASEEAAVACGPPAHRALEDARRELWLWREVRRRVAEVAGDSRARAPGGATGGRL